MSLRGRWRIVEMPDYEADFHDMMEPAYILFEQGVKMDEASGDGWAKLQPHGSLKGEIRFHIGDDTKFRARPWDSSTAC